MARRVSIKRIKAHRSYDMCETAETVGVTPQTVRAWIKQGLPALTERRPYLILGFHLRAFLVARERQRKRPLNVGEFLCPRCRVPRRPALGLTERSTLSNGRSVLRGFCEVCEAPCSRFVEASE